MFTQAAHQAVAAAQMASCTATGCEHSEQPLNLSRLAAEHWLVASETLATLDAGQMPPEAVLAGAKRCRVQSALAAKELSASLQRLRLKGTSARQLRHCLKERGLALHSALVLRKSDTVPGVQKTVAHSGQNPPYSA